VPIATKRYGSSVTVPVTLVAPGPGRFAFEFTVPFDVFGTQNAEPSLIVFGTPIDSAPAGVPTSRMSCAITPACRQVPGAGQFAELEHPSPSFAPPTQ
jgi:hypothetical protein